MYLYHAAKYEEYEYPDWNMLNTACDFGGKLYFSTDIESAEVYSADRCQDDSIARIEVPDLILYKESIQGLDIINYSYNGEVVIEHEDSVEIEQWSMGYTDQIDWTRQVLANRKGCLHLLDSSDFANIIIGPRADNNISRYLRSLSVNEEDFNDHEFLKEVFTELQSEVFSIQVALDKSAFDTLVGAFREDNWRW